MANMHQFLKATAHFAQGSWRQVGVGLLSFVTVGVPQQTTLAVALVNDQKLSICPDLNRTNTAAHLHHA